MTSKKKLKRAIRARADAEGVSYQEMHRRMGVGASTPNGLHDSVVSVAAECLRRANEPPGDVNRVARRIAGRVCAVHNAWKLQSNVPIDQVFERAGVLTSAVCDVLQPRLTPEQIQSIRAPTFRDGKIIPAEPSSVRMPSEEQMRPEISDDEIYDVAKSILVAIGALVMEKPYCGFEQMFGGVVYDYVYDPPASDEYLIDSDD